MKITLLPPKGTLVDDDAVLYELWQHGNTHGYSIEFAEKRAPVLVAACYVEVIVEIGKIAAAGIIGTLASDLVKALYRGTKTQIDSWILGIREGERFQQVEVSRENEDEANRIIREALTELFKDVLDQKK